MPLAADPSQTRQPKPAWFRVRLPTDPRFEQTSRLVANSRLHTVCESAHCPNRWECWSRSTATFMIGGDHCTRNCGFCAVSTAKPLPLDPGEPARVANAVLELGLRHAVITMVARDDLPDGAAAHVAQTVRAVRHAKPGVILEVLTSDFNGRTPDLDTVLGARADIFSHNVETVERLTPAVRARATYARSLGVLRHARKHSPPDIVTKSGLMLGLGESDAEIDAALHDIRAAGCDILTLGQYLRPSDKHLPVRHWVTPAEFDAWAGRARAIGFRYVASGPLVRSSYYADAVQLADLRPKRAS